MFYHDPFQGNDYRRKITVKRRRRFADGRKTKIVTRMIMMFMDIII